MAVCSDCERGVTEMTLAEEPQVQRLLQAALRHMEHGSQWLA